MATMRDVAAIAGVSAKTVSRVFNNDPHVTPETKQRVQAALRELNYVPNSVATTFRTGRSPVIGVAVPDIVDPFFAAMASAADSLAASHEMSVVITNLGDPHREPEVVQSLLRQALSGLIIAPAAADHSYLAPWLQHTPVVFVDRPPVGVAADSFTEDDVAGAHLATTHLLEHGHTRIGFIGDDLAIPTTKARLDGSAQRSQTPEPRSTKRWSPSVLSTAPVQPRSSPSSTRPLPRPCSARTHAPPSASSRSFRTPARPSPRSVTFPSPTCSCRRGQ